MKRGQSESQATRNAGNVRAADLVRASWTAPQKRAQRSAVSAAVVLGRGFGGVAERILTKSVLV